MCPREQTELLHVVLLDQGQHEPNESDAVQAERQEPVVLDEKGECIDAIYGHSEVIHEVLAVEEII